MKNPLFKGPVLSGVTKYVGVPIHDGVIGLDISWPDATTAGAFTLELTSFGPDLAPGDVAGTANKWKDSGVAIGAPAAAIGGELVHLENVRQLRARLVFVASADSNLEIYDGAKP